MGVAKQLNQLADDLLAAGYVDLYLFLSIVFLILFTKLLGFPEVFSIALFSTTSMPAMYSFMYYYRKPLTGIFVKPKDYRVIKIRAAYRSLAAVLTSFVMGFIVFAALSGSTDIAIYTLAFIVTFIMRVALYILLPVLASYVDIENPAIVMLTSLAVASISLLLLVTAIHIL
ncbi:MAG: hypothetical protein LM583_01105 [Desulfurococcaceae archaeon]|nr:hypothetical protein [Desulfurococcaceae archaeon]